MTLSRSAPQEATKQLLYYLAAHTRNAPLEDVV